MNFHTLKEVLEIDTKGEKDNKIKECNKILSEKEFTPNQLIAQGISVSQDGNKRNLKQVLAFPNITFDHINLIFAFTSSDFSELTNV